MTLLTSRILRIGAITGAALLAVACAETQLGAQAVKKVARTDARADPGPELAPDAFDATGLTIWDGASTLAGVWVAHPLAQRAQRVRVTNEENEIAIEGAMFRRDPTLSGPSILVSSDAARLLGLQPGVATGLRIVALREGVYAEPTTATAAAPAQTGAVETAALPAPEVTENNAAEIPPEEASEVETAQTEPGVEQANEPAAAQPAASDPVEVAEAPAPAQPAADNPAPVQPTAPPPEAADPPAPEPTPPKTAITAADLRGETAAAPAAPQPASKPAQAQPDSAQQAAEQAEAPQPAPAASPSGAFQGNLPSGRFVQAGAFGVEPNAATLVQTLKGAGLPAQYVQRDVNGSVLNIVMIGPLADDAAADAAVVAAAKAGAPGARKVTR